MNVTDIKNISFMGAPVQQKIGFQNGCKKVLELVIKDKPNSQRHSRYTKVTGLRSLQNIKGFEREIIETYKNELSHEIWGNPEKMKEWAFKKVREIVDKDYGTSLLDSSIVQEGRTKIVQTWYNILQNIKGTKNNPFLQLKIMQFVTSKLLPNNKQIAPIINKSIIEKSVSEVLKTGSAFKKTYTKNMRDFDSGVNAKTEEIVVDGIIGKWYQIELPNSIESTKKIGLLNKIKNYLSCLSQGTNWCTRNPYAIKQNFNNCIFDIFIDNRGAPQICLTSCRDGNTKWFKYIKGNDQYRPIPDKYKKVLESYLKKHGLENSAVIDGGSEKLAINFCK